MSEQTHPDEASARNQNHPQPRTSESTEPKNNSTQDSKPVSRNQRRRANKNKRVHETGADGDIATDSSNLGVSKTAEETKDPATSQRGGGRGRGRPQTTAAVSGDGQASLKKEEANTASGDQGRGRGRQRNRRGGAARNNVNEQGGQPAVQMNPDVTEFVPKIINQNFDADRQTQGRDRGGRGQQNSENRGRGGRGGRGRDGLPHGINPQNENNTDNQRGRGRGRRGDGNNSHTINPQNENNGDNQRGRGRGRRGDGNQNQQNNERGPRTEVQKQRDYFEQKKQERLANDKDTQKILQNREVTIADSVTMAEMSAAGQGSRKNNTRTGKRTYNNLGAASKYIDNDDPQQIKGQEKVQFVRRGGDRNMKDKAKIKYNFRDFLNQFENLSEQCIFLVESLAQGSQECMICHNPIYQRSALWNCKQCCQPYHLGCIKRWIQKLNKSLEQSIQENEEEEKRGVVVYQSDEESEEEKLEEGTKRFVAFFNWTCPNCQFCYAENKMPTYHCYCGRFEEPDYDPMMLPHSCGEYCDRPKNKDCKHSNCEIQCHPGACPPCNISVSVKCHCTKKMKYVPCQISQRSQYSCEDICNKVLNCGLHNCEQICHSGSCSPCSVPKDQQCFCGKKIESLLCGQPRFSCQQQCSRVLDCTHHLCDKVCHESQCLPCQKDPKRQIYCPSGHKTIASLLGRERKNCMEPIPVCESLCERFLPCGRHQCIKQCHTDECMPCEELVNKGCVCNKTKIKVPCLKVNYPEQLRVKFMTREEIDEIDNFKCKRICNQMKKCQKHHCKDVCCPIKGHGPDPEGRHLCMIQCNKKLSCGLHECTDFCHIGFCKPCKYVSAQPLYCPCKIAKLDPPIKCGVPMPSCKGPCIKELAGCGHPCSMKCHSGNCPPCLENVTRLCNCGKELMTNVFCHKSTPNCGQVCKTLLQCGHKCQKICHLPGRCFNSIEELQQKGCGERCLKEKPECGHKCMVSCHPDKPCPITPCEAELRVYCGCGAKWVEVHCKSNPNRPPIECDARCWKKQRDTRIANAFGSSQDFVANKDSIKFEYYPEEAIQFAQENLLWVKKIENQLTYIVLNKSTKHYTHLTGGKREFMTLLVHEHFKLDMCVYGQVGQKRVTDVFWRDGCKVPQIMCSEIAEMISKGIEEVKTESNISSIFEASILINNVTRGNSIDTLKKFLSNFKSDIYTEKGSNNSSSFKVHFYSWQRAKEAHSYIQYTPNQFSNCQLIRHKKEIGIQGELNLEELNQAHAAAQYQPRRKKGDVDENGFETVTR